MALSHIRTVLWTLVAVAALGATGLYVYTTMTRPAQAVALGQGDYQLVTATGEAFNRDSLKGSPSMLFFGFTHCPEVCPTTLYEMSVWFEELGDEGSNIEAYFFSLDPERDTPEVMKSYVENFTDRITGVTGNPEAMGRLAQAWNIYWKKIPLDDGDYTMDHTASIFLVDADGKFQGTIAFGEESETALAKLKRLASG